MDGAKRYKYLLGQWVCCLIMFLSQAQLPVVTLGL